MLAKTLMSFVPAIVWNILEAMMMNVVAPVFMPVRSRGDSCEPAPGCAGSTARPGTPLPRKGESRRCFAVWGCLEQPAAPAGRCGRGDGALRHTDPNASGLL